MPVFHFDFGSGFTPGDEGCEFQTAGEAHVAGVASLLLGMSDNPSTLMAGEAALVIVRDEHRNERCYTLTVKRNK